MSAQFIIEQLMHGVGYGLMLFLMAAGLTLVFGIMDTLNLSHGSLFMVGAYISSTVHQYMHSFVLAVAVAVIGTMLLAAVLERILFRRLYAADHLVQVVATVGVIFVADSLVMMIWGEAPLMASTPHALSGPLYLTEDWPYPSYRFVVLAAGLGVAGLLYVLVNHTRLGMLVRAGASNRQMAELMGLRVKRVFMVVFVLGAALAGLAGSLMAPISAVQVGMGEGIMIPAFAVIVIGGIGSMRGALIAALLVGVVEALGKILGPPTLKLWLSPAVVADVLPSLTSMLMFLLMIGVLMFKPRGLFPARG
ncbi:branched-chain amino acid ABC transporter permease [Pigmentiphaga kullae]|uniref:Branched-chain amino acid transport system permease protein n=1 Tax=Pigmentiphaga kullae TaxID=151784 RepID=A0A4Q7NMZ9_9BURK|nr:branched-chain amino acid ABC transporter permease [Pigmentiphaga kullae]RZS86591.1 branched-chain amino acid transport system permease protein [Pigmentiphaga kullae]